MVDQIKRVQGLISVDLDAFWKDSLNPKKSMWMMVDVLRAGLKDIEQLINQAELLKNKCDSDACIDESELRKWEHRVELARLKGEPFLAHAAMERVTFFSENVNRARNQSVNAIIRLEKLKELAAGVEVKLEESVWILCHLYVVDTPHVPKKLTRSDWDEILDDMEF